MAGRWIQSTTIPRVTTAAIIGAGELGGAVAQALAAREAVNRLVLIDPAARAAAGKALDIQQMGAVVGFHTSLRGSGDLSDAIGSHVCVIADRFGPIAATDDSFAPIRQLTQLLREVPLVFATADAADLMLRTVRET